MALQIFANIDRNTLSSGLVISQTNLSQKQAPQLVAGDKVSIDIFLTSSSGLLDIQAYSVQRLGIGSLNGKPTGGTFNLDFSGTNSDLAFDLSDNDLQSAIQADAGEANSTTEIAPQVFITDFNTTGQKTLPTVDSTSLTPSSTASVQRLVTGTSTVKEKWITRLFSNPIALVDTWTNTTLGGDANKKGIQGSLNLGTQGIFDLLDASTSATSTLELELTDSSGNLQTIFQAPTTIFSQVIGEAILGVIPTPSGIPTEATTFLNSFPNPTISGTLTLGTLSSVETSITNNTADINSANDDIQTGLNSLDSAKANKASPAFTGTASFSNSVSIGDSLEVYDEITTGGKVGVGIGTGVTPTAMLEVGGTIKADDLNIDSKAFYVDGTNSYIQAEKYGEGTFATLTGSENQPKTTPAFGNNGKVVENTYIKTFKIVGSGFVGLGNTPVTIVTKAGVGKYIVPQRMTVYNDYGTRAGEWGNQSGNASIQIGTFQNSANTGNFAPLLVIPQSVAETSGDWLCHRTIRNAEVKQFANRDLCLKSLNNISVEADAPDGIWYVRLEYMIIGESAGFENNVDQTVGTPFA